MSHASIYDAIASSGTVADLEPHLGGDRLRNMQLLQSNDDDDDDDDDPN